MLNRTDSFDSFSETYENPIDIGDSGTVRRFETQPSRPIKPHNVGLCTTHNKKIFIGILSLVVVCILIGAIVDFCHLHTEVKDLRLQMGEHSEQDHQGKSVEMKSMLDRIKELEGIISARTKRRCWGYGTANGCCTENYPCTLHDGDCDTNAECVGDLICGKDNCRSQMFRGDPKAGGYPANNTYDCCINPL